MGAVAFTVSQVWEAGAVQGRAPNSGTPGIVRKQHLVVILLLQVQPANKIGLMWKN